MWFSTADMASSQSDVQTHLYRIYASETNTFSETCLACHNINRLSSTPNMPPSSSHLAQVEDQFKRLGQRLLKPDYLYSARYAQPVQDFWNIHRQTSSDSTATLAALERIEQQLDRLDHEWKYGRYEGTHSDGLRVKLAAPSVSPTPGVISHKLSAFVLEEQHWILVEAEHPLARRIFMTDLLRGPPAAMSETQLNSFKEGLSVPIRESVVFLFRCTAFLIVTLYHQGGQYLCNVV